INQQNCPGVARILLVAAAHCPSLNSDRSTAVPLSSSQIARGSVTWAYPIWSLNFGILDCNCILIGHCDLATVLLGQSERRKLEVSGLYMLQSPTRPSHLALIALYCEDGASSLSIADCNCRKQEEEKDGSLEAAILSCKRKKNFQVSLSRNPVAAFSASSNRDCIAMFSAEGYELLYRTTQSLQWIRHFESFKQDCLPINAHSRSSVKQLLSLVELKLREVISREPTLLVMVVGVPNVGKSALINSIGQIADSYLPAQEKRKHATVGPFPGVTQDIAGFKIANQPSIYVLDTPGVLVPSIPDIETGLKLAVTGAVKDSVVGEVRLAQYLLALLNMRKTPLHWDRLLNERAIATPNEVVGTVENVLKDSIPNRRNRRNTYEALYIEDLVKSVQKTLCITFSEFEGNLEEERELESLIHKQLTALQKTFRIPPHKDSAEAFIKVSKKLLILFRTGKLGTFILDDLSDAPKLVSSHC
ncbi:short integuments 2, mitochondrial, partial [Phalaenopsis equestris]|uniref:short integuments 2, mitochondrial n=1 Tax=Phalaenopsis equestris TaxID=78828 RepID=UPI0009E582FC